MSAGPLPGGDEAGVTSVGQPRPLPEGDPEAVVVSPERFLNRELSWIDFDARVLALASNPSVPLLERLKFVAIFSQNLDEFFQVRVAGLKDQVAAGLGNRTADGRSARTQLREIRERLQAERRRAEQLLLGELVPALAAVGVEFAAFADLDDEDREHLREFFHERIFPVLTPLAVDPGHPFPYISDLSLNLAVVVNDPVSGDQRFARVKVPTLLDRFVALPDGRRFVPLEEIIAAHLGVLFPGMDLGPHYAFRVTRNADLTLEEEEADDLLEAVELELRRRRFGRAVRLEVDERVSAEILALLVRELDLDPEDVYLCSGPIDLGGLMSVQRIDRPDLKDDPWLPITQERLVGDAPDEPADFFAAIRQGDVLLHHPYESFSTSVEEFIRQASRDPKVLAIKLTLYRTSSDTSIITSLVRAAERGKQVAALVELKARFDEKKNIGWARELENAGVHVVYGLKGLKIHTKTTLVVREDDDGIRRYSHVGTGNYNPKTARLYDDLGLLTCDPDIGSDLTQLFNLLTGFARDPHFTKLLVAPQAVRPGIEALIAAETAHGAEGRIVLKMNSLVDPALIDSLYAASRAGVSIDLIVRGICCLRPGVPGLSENIRVRSIVGRYLEHSRIYHFGHGSDGEPLYYIGSADLMPRNLDRRVEALVPIEDEALRRRLEQIIDVQLADDRLAWELGPDSTWHRVRPGHGVESHQMLEDLARARRGRP
ncbi:MAG: RNA degradosome polyphosphate kinase [Acidobacteria bacterium]|nr:RNA degradosome polyphosphate kinase [Acidobacteriota bacterium]